MALDFFRLEKGIHVVSENGETGVKFLFGAGAPGGTTDTDNAEQGSFYQDTAGAVYIKYASGSGTDKWKRLARAEEISNIIFREERVRAATEEALTAGTTDPTSWADNDGGLDDTAFAVGEYVLGDVDGTPALWEITAISSPNLTLAAASDPLADGNNFVVDNYLPDAAGQEGKALVQYSGSAIHKIADIDWEFATGISISSGYAAANGTISSADSVESAIEKLDGNQQDLTTLSGVGQGATDLGSFTGDTIVDNRNVKEALQDLETALEDKDELVKSEQTGVTTEVTLDEVDVDSVYACKWLVQAELESNPNQKRAWELWSMHDGTASADAVNTDETKYARLRLGSFFNCNVGVDLNGVGAAQKMRLRVSASSAVTVRARRIEVLDI